MMRLVWYLFALSAALMILVPLVASAQVPPARSAQECGIVAEIALTARTLDKHGIEGEKASAMMADFYALVLAGPHGVRAELYIAAALKFAAREDKRAVEPKDIADQVALSCAEGGGDLSILGAGT